MTDIKALVAELRSYKDANATTEQLWLQNLTAADALESQQAVVETATRYQNHSNKVNRLAMYQALAALDAPKEGETP